MIITIARQLGSGGEDVGRLVAKRLDLLYADREILLRAARAGNLSELALVVDDERAPTLMERIAAYSIRVSSPNWRAEPLTPDQARILEGEYATHRHLVEEAIREIGKTNDGVVIGRGAQVILRHHPSALHVYVFAPEETRVERLVERERISIDDAREEVHASDRNREGYLKAGYNVDWRDASLYDLMINTTRLTVEAAADVIVSAATSLAHGATAGA